MSYKEKYLKYKVKYQNLINNQEGGLYDPQKLIYTFKSTMYYVNQKIIVKDDGGIKYIVKVIAPVGKYEQSKGIYVEKEDGTKTYINSKKIETGEKKQVDKLEELAREREDVYPAASSFDLRQGTTLLKRDGQIVSRNQQSLDSSKQGSQSVENDNEDEDERKSLSGRQDLGRGRSSGPSQGQDLGRGSGQSSSLGRSPNQGQDLGRSSSLGQRLGQRLSLDQSRRSIETEPRRSDASLSPSRIIESTDIPPKITNKERDIREIKRIIDLQYNRITSKEGDELNYSGTKYSKELKKNKIDKIMIKIKKFQKINLDNLQFGGTIVDEIQYGYRLLYGLLVSNKPITDEVYEKLIEFDETLSSLLESIESQKKPESKQNVQTVKINYGNENEYINKINDINDINRNIQNLEIGRIIGAHRLLRR